MPPFDQDFQRKDATLANLLSDLPRRFLGERATVGEIVDAVGDRSTALILLIFSIPAIIPTPGVPAGMIFGTALSVLAVQMVAGWSKFRLPRAVAGRSLKRHHLELVAKHAVPWLKRLERRSRPRWRPFSNETAIRSIGVVIFMLGVIIALPIPFGNVIPGVSVFLIAFGFAEKDGAMVVFGLSLSVVSLLLAIGLVFGGYWLTGMALSPWTSHQTS